MKKELFFEFVGMKIKQKREEKGLTLDELSLKTGISKIYLQKIENGKAYGLSTTRFFRIAYALDTPPHILLKD